MNPNSLKNLALGKRKRDGLKSLTLRIYGPSAALQWFRGLTAQERGEEVRKRAEIREIMYRFRGCEFCHDGEALYQNLEKLL